MQNYEKFFELQANGAQKNLPVKGYREELYLAEHSNLRTEFLWEPFIVKNSINLWAGGYGWGKSTIARIVGIRLAALWVEKVANDPNVRNPFPDKDMLCGLKLNSPDGPVLYVSEETMRPNAQRWLRYMNAYAVNYDQQMIVQGGSVTVLFSELRKEYKRNIARGIVEVAEDFGAGLVIVDTFGHIIGDNINDYHVITRVYEQLQPIVERGGTLLLLDHTAKQYYSESEGQQDGLTPIGSGQKIGQARHVVTIRFLERTFDSENNRTTVSVKMEVAKSNETDSGTTVDVDIVHDKSYDEVCIVEAGPRGVEGKIVDLLKERGEMQRKDIVEEIDQPTRTVAERLKRLIERGVVVKTMRGWYALKGNTTGQGK